MFVIVDLISTTIPNNKNNEVLCLPKLRSKPVATKVCAENNIFSDLSMNHSVLEDFDMNNSSSCNSINRTSLDVAPIKHVFWLFRIGDKVIN